MIRLQTGSQSVRRRPRPVTVCLGHDVAWGPPGCGPPGGAGQRGPVRRGSLYGHELLRGLEAVPAEPRRLCIVGPQVIHNLHLLHINVTKAAAAKVTVSGWACQPQRGMHQPSSTSLSALGPRITLARTKIRERNYLIESSVFLHHLLFWSCTCFHFVFLYSLIKCFQFKL